MNRYLAAGILADMRAGRRVVVLSGTRTESRHAFTEVATHATGNEHVRRSNGQERITAEDGQGWVIFGTSSDQQFRGFDADVVVFDAHHPKPQDVDAARPLITGTRGELIR